MRHLLLLLLVARALSGAYQYYYTDPLTSVNAANWQQNGSVTATSGGFTAPSATGGSLISKVMAPGSPNEYEVNTTLTLVTSGGTYVQYLHASPDALSGPGATGTYYAVEFQNPSFSGGGCMGTLALYKRSAGVVTLLGSTPAACWSGMKIRTVYNANAFTVLHGDTPYFSVNDGTISTGQPGVGAYGTPAGNTISLVDLGPHDGNAPAPVAGQSIGSSSFPNRVDLQWQGVVDDPNGSGLFGYVLAKNGVYNQILSANILSDEAVSPSSTYTYTLYSIDRHWNVSGGTTITITTPPEGSVDPRRNGTKPLGTYWGAGGEQVDVLSGNLNYSLPLLKAHGRGGWNVPFALTYNSQLWRHDDGGTWKLGQDVGYGFGWKLLAGSVTPFWESYYTINHYIYTDSSGAEYRLDVNDGGVWRSTEGIYARYDTNTQRLYFRDGTFWVMGAVSAGAEQDTGTRYPTLLQDTNGNQVRVRYYPGKGVTWNDSSARIQEIEDVRSIPCGSGRCTYSFSYNTDPIPHLNRVWDYVGTGANYTFGYFDNQNLYSPFSPPVAYGTTDLLQGVTIVGLGIGHTFEYDASGSGELTRVVLPYGGHLRWEYAPMTYLGNRTLREVQTRHLAKSSGATETSYGFYHAGDDGNRTVHSWTTMGDQSGPEKAWWFQTEGPAWQIGLETGSEERMWGTAVQHRDLTWTQDAAGNPYVASVLTTLDPNTAYAKQKKTEQVLDGYGNVTQTRIYDWGNLTTPARTYNQTYLSDPGYISRYIYNRLLTSTVTDGTRTVTLVSNAYDRYTTSGYWFSAMGSGELRGHDAAYGTSYYPRGNVSWSDRPGTRKSFNYDITGAMRAAWDERGSLAITTEAASGFAVPTLMTPNGTASLATSASYTPFLAVASVTRPNTSTSSFTYDSLARPLTSTSPLGAVTNYTYTNSPPTRNGTTGGHWEKETYDGLGRVIKVEKGDGSGTKSVVDTEYVVCACSAVGKLWRVSQPYAPGGAVYWTTYTYDALGRTVAVAHPDNSGTTTYTYQGNTVTVTDPAGKWKRYTTDAFGNLTRVTEPNPAGGADHETYYAYDLLDHLTGVTMPRDGVTQTRTFTYDATTQRLMSVTHPETGTTSYTYNTDGTVATKTDARGRQATYTYDSHKRVTRRSTTNACETVNYYYDTNPFDGAFTQNGWGRLVAVDYRTPLDANCELYQGGTKFIEMYSYTAGGRVAKKRLRVIKHTNPSGQEVTNNLEMAYTYNAEGQVTRVTYPDGTRYAHVRDGMGRAVQLDEVDQNGQVLANWVRNMVLGVAGELRQLEVKNEQGYYYGETRSYNARLQVTLIRWGTSGTYYNYSATQNNGRVVSSQPLGYPSELVNYTYDALNRLVRAETVGPTWGNAYTYDGFGNLRGKTVTKGTAPYMSVLVNGATNRIAESGYQYDAAGNLTSTPYSAMVVGYDVDNRVGKVQTSSGTEYYGYGVDNRRVWRKDTAGEEWVYVRGAYGEEMGIYRLRAWRLGVDLTRHEHMAEFAGRVVRRYGWAVQGAEWPNRVGSTSSGARYPYGEVTDGWGLGKFATYEQDATGLYYGWNRYYHSGFGRFLSADPYVSDRQMANPQGWNRYAYVEGDPVNYYDPKGLDRIYPMLDPGNSWAWVGGGGGGGACQLRWSGGENGYWSFNCYLVPIDTPTARVVPEQPKSSKDCDTDLTSSQLDDYLKEKRSPLAGEGDRLIHWGRQYNVDPRLVIALAGAETTFGNHITRGEYNAWNWLYNGPGKEASFVSWNSAIHSVTKGLGGSYLHHATDPRTDTESVYGKYCVGPDCANGLKNLNLFMREQGANTSGLEFPCK